MRSSKLDMVYYRCILKSLKYFNILIFIVGVSITPTLKVGFGVYGWPTRCI